MMAEDVPPRQRAIEQLTDGVLDVLVIGGGIVGAGIARDAAMRGLRVGLVDQQDFAAGTSSRSSRLLHGGLRYLAQGRLPLVREASVEKRTIQHIAPHLARPLAFIFPTRAGDPDWQLWKLKIGVKLYDALCGWKNLGRSRWLSASQVRACLPQLDATRLNGAVRYFDGLTNDARLVLDTLRSAARAGAILCNRARFERADRDGEIWRCDITDVCDQRPLEVRARWIVNAAGPWADRFPHGRLHLRLTKGVHLLIDRERLPLPDAVVLTDARRILFAIPWGRRVILGTTDTDYDGPPEKVACNEQDIAYLLRIVNAAFPAVALTREDIRGAWAGLRPLIADGNDQPSDVSRAHQILLSQGNWLDVAGGKLTTYRLIAEQVVDRILHAGGWGKVPCRTADEPLVEPAEAEGISSIEPPEVTRQAVEHYCRNEWAMTLEDVMVRRSGWHYYLPDPLATAREIAPWMAAELHWDEARLRQELADYETTVAAPFSKSVQSV
jgi:glycerol-3-phosphate dehydrogenase